MKELISSQQRRFGYAFKGFCSAFHSDRNFRLQVYAAPFYFLFAWLVWPLTQTEILFLVLSYSLILGTELQNTSFEKALDRLHPELHDEIGASKDMAAASVLTAGIFSLIVILVITATRLV
jgi:diacylglycerol kinase (ATP)